MIRRQEAARAAALFLSFAAFFMTCPLTLWDAALFAQISIDRAVEVLAINGLMATSAVLAVGTGLWSMARDSVRMMPAATVLGGVAYALGGSAYALVQTLALPVGPAGICVISVAMGFGLAMLVLGWCRVLCPFGLKRSLLGMSIACAMATFVELGFEAGLLPAREGAFAVLLWLGVAGPVWSACKGVGEIPAVDDTVGDHLWESMRTMVLNPCLGLFLFLFIMSAREFVFMEYEHIGAISVIGAAGIAVALVRFWPRFSLGTVYRTLLPSAAAFFIVLSSFPVGSVSFGAGFLVSHILMAAIALLALASLCAVARAGEFSSVFVGSILCVATSLAVLLGTNVAQVVPDDDALGAILLVCAMAYFVYVLASPLVDYHRLLREGEEGEEVRERDGLPQPHSDALCAALAEERNLSAREREILPYIARGHRPAYVADMLCISEHTVRTHLRNIYRKLGVGSREELIQLVENVQSANR